jgi:hypothetical protein
MKTILVAIGIVAVTGCTSPKQIQVELVNAELIKIDTIFRQTNDLKQLTWKDKDQIQYVSFAAMNEVYPIGTRMLVMRTR